MTKTTWYQLDICALCYMSELDIWRRVDMSLKHNLIKYMRLREKTIKELSEMTDISEATLKRLRTIDDVNPTLDVLIKLGKALEITINELVSDNESLKNYTLGIDIINPNNTQEEFVVVFQEDLYNFKAGTRAIFRRYAQDIPLTKYIIRENTDILKLLDANDLLFVDLQKNIISLQKDKITAYIVKQLYEVTYV